MGAGRSLIALPAPPAQRVVRALTRTPVQRPWHARLTPGERRTIAIGVVAAATSVGLFAAEVGRFWRRGSAPLPHETDHVLQAAEIAVEETVIAARAGYQDAPSRANALFNLLASFVTTFAAARSITYLLRGRRRGGPFRDLHIARRHIHHYVPGIMLAFTAGAIAICTNNEEIEPTLALVFGVGMGLTLDESALLLELEDVYWSEEGLLSVQITLAVIAFLGMLGIGVRFVRRGEQLVLEDAPAG
jgi:hypothetical protein